MIGSEKKCVMVIDESLPAGISANTAAILGVTLGERVPALPGPDVTDASGKTHAGIVTIPVPILKGTKESLKNLRSRLYEPEFSELIVVDFSDIAQCCNVYDGYIAKARETEEKNFIYLGIGVYGDKRLVNKLTGSLPLLR